MHAVQCDAILSEGKGEKLETKGTGTRHLILFAAVLVCGRPYKAFAPRKLLV